MLDLEAFSKREGIKIKREVEKKASLYLLSELLNNMPFELYYSPQNKPYLKESPCHISISHSHNKLAIILNTRENTGIDIELIRDKVLSIQHKFLNPKEKLFANNEVDKLITFWAAKEALYKLHGLKGLDFSKDLSVEWLNDSELIGNIESDKPIKSFKLHSEKVDEYRLVYVLNGI